MTLFNICFVADFPILGDVKQIDIKEFMVIVTKPQTIITIDGVLKFQIII